MLKNILSIFSYCITFLFLCACESDTQFNTVTTGGKQNTILSQLSTQQKPAHDAVVIVNGQSIPRQLLDYYSQYKKAEDPQLDFSGKTDELKDQLINIEVLAQYAEKKGLHKDLHISNRLEFERKNTLANIVLNQALSRFNITDKEINNEYKKQYENKKTIEYKARHILMKNKSTATNIINQLNRGVNFSKLAEEYSISPSAPVGGALEWFSAERTDKDFMNAVTNLKKGAYTSSPVKTAHGWNIILLDDTREVPAPDLESVRVSLENALFDTYMKKYIQKLREKANIEIIND